MRPGWANTARSRVPEQRAFLASISPYNQLKPDVNYPEPLIFTTTKDDRVGPVHARKFAAKMEEFHKPFFYQEIIEGGHGFGADLKEQAKTQALCYIYLTQKLMDSSSSRTRTPSSPTNCMQFDHITSDTRQGPPPESPEPDFEPWSLSDAASAARTHCRARS